MISHWLGNSIEQQYPQMPIAALAKAQAIVVLGGAMSPPQLGGSASDPYPDRLRSQPGTTTWPAGLAA